MNSLRNIIQGKHILPLRNMVESKVFYKGEKKTQNKFSFGINKVLKDRHLKSFHATFSFYEIELRNN